MREHCNGGEVNKDEEKENKIALRMPERVIRIHLIYFPKLQTYMTFYV